VGGREWCFELGFGVQSAKKPAAAERVMILFGVLVSCKGGETCGVRKGGSKRPGEKSSGRKNVTVKKERNEVHKILLFYQL